MIDEKIEELMWLEIDESISANDRETLLAYLNAHPEAREYFDQIREMSALFGGVAEIEPPPELRTRIRTSIEMTSPSWVHKDTRQTFWSQIRGVFEPRPAWRMAAAAVVGMFVGIIGYHIVSYNGETGKPLDNSQLSGTMTLLRDVDRRGPGVDIEIPGASGSLTVQQDGSRVISELDVSSDSEIDVMLIYDGSALEYGGSNLSDRSSNQVTIEDRGIRVRNRGEGTYYFLFQLHDDPAAPLVVKILAEDTVLFEEKVYPERTFKKE
ncbi:MAG: anti-sigma factor [Candidatus Latescibacterota bacterium]|nr:MAG: anti-sigma factor [Candidatus Latescibacterota bacterium]